MDDGKAVEEVFKGLEKIDEYTALKRNATDSNIESESALVKIEMN
jgi:hypothetical protein